MSAPEISTKWINLAIHINDNGWFGRKIKSINAHEFILCTTKYVEDSKLFKYNIDTNTFNELFIQNNDHWRCDNMDFNQQEQILYVQNWKKNNIMAINMKTSNINYLCDAEFKNGEYFFFINNCFHMIGMHDHHWIGSIQNKSLNVLHNTLNYRDTLECGKAIYIPSKQCILLIGGYYYDDGPLSNEVWIYKLTTQKWIKINNISFQRYHFEAILTSNERYIVLFGGWKFNKGYVSSDDIFVLDIKDDNNWKIKKCEIKCPLSGKCIGAKTGEIGSKNDMLVNGFVKECFKLKEFKHMQLPPMYIVSIISKWYSAEMIHWIQKDKHYGIYLKHILSSLY